MKGEEVIDILNIERACIECQKRCDCKHECQTCSFAVPGDKLIEAVDKAIEVLVFVESRRKVKK